MKLRTLLILLSFFCSINIYAQNKYQSVYDSFTQDKELAHTSIGFYAIDANTGEVLASSPRQVNLVPASILKLVTTSAALDILGADYRFKTQLYYTGTISGNRLDGNLIIRGGGDPALGSKYFSNYAAYKDFMRKWAAVVRSKGIKHISGSVLVDEQIYDQQSIPSTWVWEDMGNYYGAGVRALSVFDNMCTIHFQSPANANQATQITKVTPHVPNMEIDNQVRSSNINRDRAYVYGSPFDSYRVIRGTIPKGRSDFKVKASLPQPSRTFVYMFEQELSKAGIDIERKDYTAAYNNDQLLGEIDSPVLADIVRVTNHESVNLFAEHLVKQLAYEQTGHGDFNTGMQIIHDYWAERGVEFSNMEDGCGLSRFNSVRADQMTKVLYEVKNNAKISEAFYRSLPAVPNGTLWYFNRNLFPNKSLHLKSGSMTGVRSFAGTLRCTDGTDILFTVIFNQFDCSQSRIIKELERMLSAMRTQ